MSLVEYSVQLPFSTIKAEQVLPYASLVEWTGARRLWQGQTFTVEPHQAFTFLAGTGTRIPVGLGVTLMPLRHPFEAAIQAASMARIIGQDLTIGYGPGGRNFQAMLRAAPYRSPLTATREYVQIVKGLLAGGLVEFVGEYFTCHGAVSSTPVPRVEVAMGVLRERMATLAGQVADAAITWLTPAQYLRDTVVPALRAGAAEAGRRPPRLVAIVPLALSRPGRTASELALASNAAHLQAPHYQDMLRKAGVDVAKGHAPEQAAGAVVNAGAFLYGDADFLVRGLKEYEAAGVDEVVLNLTGVYNSAGPAKTLAELKLLLKTVGVL
ncbi:LLM class flavin-dependent oxidoreductase [Rhizomonospora bruguierae]|uniref:LLM class flavin-dependent oxidoreductase n=1 Tax=Rhizomonospora bruguierae TaxID=1581705 RepID=UPI0020C00FD1|nr:LLM class flavin-dependent oxidoreductase [Micromonospora sp. NBRC 107566]